MQTGTVLACALLLTASTLSAAFAQETRAEAQRQQREEKQRTATPYAPSTVERALKAIETGGVPLITRDGLYAKLGSLTTGSGFAYGAGYRTRRFISHDGGLDAWGGASLKGYWAAEARVRFQNVAGGHLLVEGLVRRHEYPQEDFFGLGPDSLRADQADFTMRATTIGARVAVRPVRVLAAGGGVEYLTPRVSNGTDKAVPSIGDQFDDASAPGLSAQPDYLRTIAFVEGDWRRPLNARNGGWYRLEFSRYDDRDLGAYTFNRLDVDVRQFVSFLSEERVLVGRAAMSTSDAADGQQMPFYLMPTLGGNDSLRGFRDYRFRGPHALLLQGEYRFEIWAGLDAALFYDAGKVAMRRADLDLDNLESDYGVGFRFNTDNGIVLRVDAAFGSPDGKHLWIVFGGRF